MDEKVLLKKLSSYKKIIAVLIGTAGILLTALGGAVAWIWTQKVEIDNLKTNYVTLRLEITEFDKKIDNAASDVYKDVEILIQNRILTEFYTKLKTEINASGQ